MIRLFGAIQDDELTSVTQRAISRVLVVSALVLWLGLLSADILFSSLPMEALLIVVVSILLCLVCWRINQHRPSLAASVYLLGALVIIAVAAETTREPIVFSLFTVIVIISATLLNLTAAFVVTLFSCVSIVVFGFNELPRPQIWLLLVSTTAALLISASVSKTTRALLEWLRDNQQYALEQLEASRDSRGELARVVKALTEAEAQLRHLNIQLRYARNAAEEVRRLKVQFATNVSHELRTPINLIIGFSEIMALAPEIYGIPLDPNYRADIQAIYRNARHLQNLINDILDIAQVESGHLAIVKEETEPLSIIHEAVAMTREHVESKGLALKTDLPPALPTMLLDRTRIRQVLLNLLANAVRFTDRGSITVKASLNADHLLISVTDTGIGIARENLERVFDEFFQVAGSTARPQSGTGLGLALSKQFIAQQGGRMWAESEGQPGLGTTMNFTLPIRDARIFGMYRGEQQVLQDEQIRHLVVFDSDPNIVQLFKGYARNHQVFGSHLVSEIVGFLRDRRGYKIIVADQKGIEEIRDLIDLHCPSATIITSPIPSGKHIIKALGVSDYLVKPVSRQALLKSLRKIMPPVRDILIIDDDRDMVRMYRRMLQASPNDFRIRVAYNGREGLSRMREKRPDVVILDIMMPEVDGFSVIHLISMKRELRGIPVIVISARGPGEMISEFARGEIHIANPAGYKPVELVRLVEAVADSISVPVDSTL